MSHSLDNPWDNDNGEISPSSSLFAGMVSEFISNELSDSLGMNTSVFIGQEASKTAAYELHTLSSDATRGLGRKDDTLYQSSARDSGQKTVVKSQRSTKILSPDGSETEYVPVTSADPPGFYETLSKRGLITREQVQRQLQKCIRDGQELSRILRKGTKEWWTGPTNRARRRELLTKIEAWKAEFAAVRSGSTTPGDIAFQVATDGLEVLERNLGLFLNDPAGISFAAFAILQEQTTAFTFGLQDLVSGEIGSQSQPFRYALVDTYDGDDAVLVEETPMSDENFELL